MTTNNSWSERWVEERKDYTDNSAKWSARAPHYGAKPTKNDYSHQFIQQMNLPEGASVLDMGCGNGLLALPLARAGHPVLACDFSEGMLKALHESIEKEGVTGIQTKLMSWEDTWEDFGVMPQSVDVAFASRSIITNDLRTSLLKLTRTARTACYATLGTGASPKISLKIMQELGADVEKPYDFQFAFNILVEEGFFPTVTYLKSDRRMHFATEEAACKHIAWMLNRAGDLFTPAARQAAEQAIPVWVQAHLEPNELVGCVNGHGEVEGAFKIVIPDDIIWAFMSWTPHE